jgi:WD40 repeat protein
LHDAFISYSRKDKVFAARLHKALANYQPPRDLPLPQRRLDVFLDEDDFTGTEYFQSVERHLKDSGKLIVLCSPAARASQFVNDEIERFANTRGPEHIISLLIAGLPNNEATASDQSALMAFPDALCAHLKMPLAADYRGFDPDRSRVDRGAYEASWYTTLANLYDISRAQIEERDRKRRARWRKIVVGSVLVAGIVVGGLGTFGVMRSLEAKREKNLKVANTLTYDATRRTESDEPSQDLRRAALLAAESLRTVWTDGGYRAWRKATLQMPPVLGNIETEQLFFTLAFSRDSKRLFALSPDGADIDIHVLSVPDLGKLHKFRANSTAFDLAVDAVGEQVLAYHGGYAELFRIGSTTPRSFPLDDSIRAASFTPAGEAVVASLTTLWALDAATGKPVSRAAFPASTKGVVMSPDGRTVLARSEEVLAAYDTVSGELRWQVPAGDAGQWHDALFSGDGRQVTFRGTASLVNVDAASGTTAKLIPTDDKVSGKLVHFDGESYVIGDSAYAVDRSWASRLPFRGDPKENYARLPVASPSGRYIAGTVARRRGDFAIFDVSRQGGGSLRDSTRYLYVTLEEGAIAKAAAFSANGDLLAVSAQAGGSVGGPAALQLVSLKRQPWSPFIPGRWHTPTADFAVVPPEARVVVERPQPVRIFDSVGVLLEGATTGSSFSASGRLVARREGRDWVVTDTIAKHTKRIPASSPIEFSPDEQHVLVFPDIHALNKSDPPRKLAATRPLFRTSSYPGANLVIGLYAGQADKQEEDTSVLFDWASGKISTGPRSRHAVYAVSPDGKRFAAHDDGGFALWHVGNSKPTVQLVGETLAASYDTMIQYSPDGALLARGGCPFTRLFDAHTLELNFVLVTDGCFAGFSPDGKFVVSSRRHGDYVPEPTYNPITRDGVLAETCAKVRTDVSPREQTRMKITEATEAACRQAAASPQDKAVSSR